MATPTRAAFPVGLYGMLLLAVCWLLLPELLRPVERFLLGVACLPQRFVAHAGGQPALAAEAHRRDQLLQLHLELQRRSRIHDVDRARTLMLAGLEPLLCRVRAIATTSGSSQNLRRGGGGVPCELLLDHSYAELAGCADLVTCGDQLLGFLARPGVGTAEKDRAEDPARVLLLNHPSSREVAAALPLPGGASLHCVVGPAAVVDPVPLRTTLHDDPYRAARLQEGGAPVRTSSLDAAWIGAVPAGLLLGHTRIWGYDVGGETLTIGLYVEPPGDPRALPQVVVWQSVPGLVPAPAETPMVAARAFALPDGGGGRWLLTADAAMSDGAAVVQDGVCLGTVRGVAFGQALCTSFAASRHAWSLWLLPDDAETPPQGLWGEVVLADGATAWFRPRAAAAPLAAGFVFTGGNGPVCPAGLLIGRAEPDVGRDLLRITLPARTGAQSVFVVAEAP